MRLHKLYLEATGGAAVEYEGAKETVVCELTGVTTDIGSREVYLLVNAYFTLAAATTITVVRVRRGLTTAGTEVGKCEIEGIAAKKNECSFACKDLVGETANGSYCVTLTETKAGEKPKSVETRLRAEY